MLSYVLARLALGAIYAIAGGEFAALNHQSALFDSFNPFAGLIRSTGPVTAGAHSITGALAAVVAFTVPSGLFQTYLPTTWAEFPVIVFGSGAITLARDPAGIIAVPGRQPQPAPAQADRTAPIHREYRAARDE